ncbi:MAG: shikimate dehydrogenase [Bacteroidia bacterium]
MKTFALVGQKLGHSFSRAWFTSKFEREGLEDYRYLNLELERMEDLQRAIKGLDLSGFNVTIPYKAAILPYLSEISPEAAAIGAVNTVKVIDGKLLGFNTDVIGFEKTLLPLLKPCHTQALILGTGGAARAAAYVLRKLDIDYSFVSRTGEGEKVLRYAQLTMLDIRNAGIIINASPAGMFPATENKPDIPYEGVDKYHLLYDMVYNPPVTRFMEQGELYGACTKNGYDMLIGQAEAAWEIWNSPR